jgi:hypothetical protein
MPSALPTAFALNRFTCLVILSRSTVRDLIRNPTYSAKTLSLSES